MPRHYVIRHQSCGGKLKRKSLGKFQCEKCLEIVNIGNPIDDAPYREKNGQITRARNLSQLDKDNS